MPLFCFGIRSRACKGIALSLGSKELILKILQEHYKVPTAIGTIDAITLFCLTWAYIEKGELPYSQWFQIFGCEAVISGALVFLVTLCIIWWLYPIEKKRASYEW